MLFRSENPPKASEKKGETKISKFYKKKRAQKCNERLTYKAKGVEPNSKVEMNKRYKQDTLEVLTQYNP